MSGLDLCLTDWRPEPLTNSDGLAPSPAAALAAVLGTPENAPSCGEPLPPLWHWVYFLRWPPNEALGADGHPAEGPFLPPIPDRRRMFAGGRLTMMGGLRVGTAAECTSVISGHVIKHGRTGEMLFVTVRTEYRQDGRVQLVEEQDLVYRSGDAKRAVPEAGARSPRPPRPPAVWSQPFTADPVLLFRFSAITANAHRIHYDQPYAHDVEHYQGLVVHGPLLVLRMMELARASLPKRRIESVDYRLRRPVFAGNRSLVVGDRCGPDAATMAIVSEDDEVMAQADITFASSGVIDGP